MELFLPFWILLHGAWSLGEVLRVRALVHMDGSRIWRSSLPRSQFLERRGLNSLSYLPQKEKISVWEYVFFSESVKFCSVNDIFIANRLKQRTKSTGWQVCLFAELLKIYLRCRRLWLHWKTRAPVRVIGQTYTSTGNQQTMRNQFIRFSSRVAWKR